MELKAGLYIKLFHGFKNMKERNEAGDWGAEGPVIGPLKWVHCAYMTTLNFEFVSEDDAKKFGLTAFDDFFEFKEGCIVFNGMQYGDWSIFYHEGGEYAD